LLALLKPGKSFNKVKTIPGIVFGDKSLTKTVINIIIKKVKAGETPKISGT
jgi:hypothetical protein